MGWFRRWYQVRIQPWFDAWQEIKLLAFCPGIEMLLADYRRFYQDTADAVLLSLEQRRAQQIEQELSLTYGETRWVTFIKLLQQLNLQADDQFVDLGCGAGFLCLMVAYKYQIPTYGYDLIEGFIDNGKTLAQAHDLPHLHFIRADFFKTAWPPATLFYATCTCFSDETMQRLGDRFQRTAVGTRLVTVTRRLPEVGSGVALIKKTRLSFSWGREWVYVWERV